MPWTRNLSYNSLVENCIDYEVQTDRNYYVIWDRRTWLWNFNLLSVVFKKLACQRNKKWPQRRCQSRRGRDGGRGGSSPSRYSCKHFFALILFPMLKCTSTISKFTNLMDLMRTNLTVPTTSREPSLNRRQFCTARGTTMKIFLIKLWKRLCLNLFSQRKWKCLTDLMASCCVVKWGLIFSPLLNCCIQTWKVGYD